MADRTLTVNGQPFTFNRDRFAGVRTMTVTGKPLDDNTTSIQVTVAGHADLDGKYTTSGVGTAAIWLQQGGNGRIESGGYNSEGDYIDWVFRDVNDGDPTVTYYGTQTDDRPWKPSNTGIVTITPAPETVTVDRTAQVIDSDRKGESRPLLSKVVGGAAAAYSLRDLNDKAGNNKVVDVRRSSGGEQAFLAKEVSNGTLTAWVGAGNDGFVAKWYDQSGNGHHALQPTEGSQPKIVSSGSLVADNAIDFDGSQFLQADSVAGMGSTISIFEASVRDSGGAAVVSMGSSASTGNTNFGIIEGGTVSNVNARNTTSVTTSASVSGTTRLTFGVTTGQTSTKVGALGGTLSENTSDYGSDFTSGELDTIFLGKLRASSGSLFNGRIREAIIYNSDETANHLAIVANIKNQYDIS